MEPYRAVSAPGQNPAHVPADGGESVFLVGDTYTTLLSPPGRALRLLPSLADAEAGPAYHREEETFFLLDGHMVFNVGAETYDARTQAPPMYIPRDVAHSYRNVGEGPAKMLFMYSPAGMEAMFPEIGKPGRRGVVGPPLDRAELAAMAGVAEKYHFSFITPEAASGL